MLIIPQHYLQKFQALRSDISLKFLTALDKTLWNTHHFKKHKDQTLPTHFNL